MTTNTDSAKRNHSRRGVNITHSQRGYRRRVNEIVSNGLNSLIGWVTPYPVIQVLTDCTDDLAQNKVFYITRLNFGRLFEIAPFQKVPSFKTHVLGKLLENYVQRDGIKTYIIANCAPRIKGEGLKGGEIFVVKLKNGVTVLGTNGPGVLDPIVDLIDEYYEIDTDALVKKGVLKPTQFRSYAWFAPLLAKFIRQDPELVTRRIHNFRERVIPYSEDFAWLEDSFENIKLTLTKSQLEEAGIEPGDSLVLRYGDYLIEATYGNSLFPLPDWAGKDDIRIYPGSDKTLAGDTYCELAIAHGHVGKWIEDNAKLAYPGQRKGASLEGGETIEVLLLIKECDRDLYGKNVLENLIDCSDSGVTIDFRLTDSGRGLALGGGS